MCALSAALRPDHESQVQEVRACGTKFYRTRYPSQTVTLLGWGLLALKLRQRAEEVERTRQVLRPLTEDDLVAVAEDLNLGAVETELLRQANRLAVAGLKNLQSP